MTLEELDRKWNYSKHAWRLTNIYAEVFSVPTSKFIHYELTVWLPWFIKHHVFRRDIPRPPPIIATAEEARQNEAA